MTLNHKKIKEAIRDLQKLEHKFNDVSTMFIRKEINDCINKIGWAYANLSEAEKKESKDKVLYRGPSPFSLGNITVRKVRKR